MRLKARSKIVLSAMMALTIINVYIGKALDIHPDLQYSKSECSAAGTGTIIEEYCYICHFHLASFIETETAAFSLVAVFEERPFSPYLLPGEAPEIRNHALRAPPVLS